MLSPAIKGREWTKEEKEYLKANYSTDNIDSIANHLGRSRRAVKVKACKMGLKSGRFLTEKQIAEMEKYYFKSNVYFAKKFKKNERSIIKSRNRLGIGMASETDMLCLADVARVTGASYQAVKERWRKKGLIAQRNGLYVFVTEKQLIAFLQEHPELWDATKCEKEFFNRYDWFAEKHKKDFDKMIEKRWGKC